MLDFDFKKGLLDKICARFVFIAIVLKGDVNAVTDSFVVKLLLFIIDNKFDVLFFVLSDFFNSLPAPAVLMYKFFFLLNLYFLMHQV